MKKRYHAFKRWINKKKAQHAPSQKTIVWIIPVVLIVLIILDTNNKLTDVLGLSTKMTQTQTADQPSPTTIITDTPTETPSPTTYQEQVQQQTYQPPAQNTQSVGENTIDCVGPDGKHLRVTQKDCDSFNNAWKPTQAQVQQNTENNNNGSLITCVLWWGNYQTTQSNCDSLKKDYAQSQQQFIQTQQQENSQQQAQLSQPAQIPWQMNPTPTQIPQQNNNAYLNSQCQSQATNTYNTAQQNALGMYGGQSSASQAIISIAQQQYTQDLATCNSEYPTN